MAMISITNPARIIIGAIVMRVVLYTLVLSKTFGSGLLPPAIKINPSAITTTPINIHFRFVLSNIVPMPAVALTVFEDFAVVAELVVLAVAMNIS